MEIRIVVKEGYSMALAPVRSTQDARLLRRTRQPFSPPAKTPQFRLGGSGFDSAGARAEVGGSGAKWPQSIY